MWKPSITMSLWSKLSRALKDISLKSVLGPKISYIGYYSYTHQSYGHRFNVWKIYYIDNCQFCESKSIANHLIRTVHSSQTIQYSSCLAQK